jgi:hypothetical protein
MDIINEKKNIIYPTMNGTEETCWWQTQRVVWRESSYFWRLCSKNMCQCFGRKGSLFSVSGMLKYQKQHRLLFRVLVNRSPLSTTLTKGASFSCTNGLLRHRHKQLMHGRPSSILVMLWHVTTPRKTDWLKYQQRREALLLMHRDDWSKRNLSEIVLLVPNTRRYDMNTSL